MTQPLKVLLERAADVDFDAPDLDRITDDGARIVRRRRVGLGAAGLVAAAAIVGAVVTTSGGHDGDVHPADGGPGVDDVTWVEGSVLHSTDSSADLGQRVHAYVRTRAGFAFVADDGGVHRYRDGDVDEIGRVGADIDSVPRIDLVADGEDGVVGWVDHSGVEPAFVVHDLATGEQSRYDEHTGPSSGGGSPLADFFAIDDGTAYWLDARGTVETDLGTGEAVVIAPPSAPELIDGVENGRRILRVRPPGGLEVVDAAGTVLLRDRDSLVRVLSPDARWAAGAHTAVWDLRTGRQHELDVEGDSYAYQWADSDTVVVLSSTADGAASALMTCEVPAGDCTVVEHLGAVGLVLPVGG